MMISQVIAAREHVVRPGEEAARRLRSIDQGAHDVENAAVLDGLSQDLGLIRRELVDRQGRDAGFCRSHARCPSLVGFLLAFGPARILHTGTVKERVQCRSGHAACNVCDFHAVARLLALRSNKPCFKG
jgi:hypothetical protein